MMVRSAFIYSLLLIVVLSKEITLVKQNDQYFFKVNVGNLKMNLNSVLSLERQHTWVKSQECKYCQLIINQDKLPQTLNNKNIEKFDEKTYDCSANCFDKAEEQYGLKCVQTHDKCKVLEENVQITTDSKKLAGKLIQVKIQSENNHQKFQEFQTVLVQRIYDNLFQKTNKQTKNDQNKQDQQNIVGPVGYYMIWGTDSLFETNILTKNSKNQIVVYDGISSNNLQKQILQDVSPIQVQFEESVTQFALSQIKLGERITLNHPQKQTEDHEIPILPLQKGFITLQTQNLVLPKKHYQKLIEHLLLTYFSSQNNKCEFKDNKITCEKSLNLDKVEYLQLELILNGISIGFPFKSLLKNIKGKSCEVRMSVSPNQTQFALGTFFLEIFAVEFIEQTENIKLYRLNNQWNKFYSKNEKYHKQNFNIFWWMGSSIIYAIFYVFKIIFYLAIFSLVVNFLYHWRKILQWMEKIFDRIKKRKSSKQSGELFQNEQDLQSKDTAKLIKRFKNRRNKVFVEDNNELLNDQITTQQSG